MGRGIVIENVDGKKFRKGRKTRIRFPSQVGGTITRTFVSRKAAEADIKNLNKFAKNRVKITNA